MIFCNNKKCVFYKEEAECLLPNNENFRITENDVVIACLNYIQNEKDLSAEGKAKLKKLKGGATNE